MSKPYYEYHLTLGSFLEYALYMNPDEEIIYKDKLSYNYRLLRDRVARLASALEQLGVKTANGPWAMGDKIASLDWNTIWHYEAYLAVPMMGAVLHTINIRLAPMEILYVMNHARDKIAIVHQDFLQLINAIAGQVESLEKIIVLRETEDFEVPDRIAGKPVYEYEALLRDYGDPNYKFPEDLHENTVAGMAYTSGTTGLPKGVYHTHRQMVIHALSGALYLSAFMPKELALRIDTTIMHIVPMFHVFSWGVPYISTLLGLKQVYPGRFDPGFYLKLLAEYKVNFTAGVPTILYMLLTHPDFPKYREAIKGLVFVCGGAAIPRGLAELAWKNGIRVVQGYGLSETAPILTISTLKKYLEKQVPEEKKWEYYSLRTGLPVPLVQLRVVDEDMNPVPRDGKSMGEIVVRTPWVTREYYQDPEKTEKAWRGGWFHTGDIAVWDEHGYVLIMDRDKDVIKSGGEWISSLRLESLISTHECVGEVAVIGAKHEKWGERPVALVVPKPGCENRLKPEDVIEHLKHYVETGVIPKWWLPDKVVIVSEPLPKTSVGKINKRVLREKYSNIQLG